VAAAAWGLGLVIVVGVAWAGGPGQGTADDPLPTASVTPTAQLEAAGTGRDTTSDPIVLDWPATPNQVITTPALVVRGHLSSGAGRVQVLLQSSGAELIVVRTVGPVTADWDRDGNRRPAFSVTLPLPDPRPSGPAVVQVVAYDISGRAQSVLLRPVQIGPLFDPSIGGLPGRPALGEDGLIGGIPFDTNWSPDSTGS